MSGQDLFKKELEIKKFTSSFALQSIFSPRSISEYPLDTKTTHYQRVKILDITNILGLN
jgi:hypothetical protein